MTIIIEVYIIVCVALLIFDIAFMWIKNRRTNGLYPHNTKFEETIRMEARVYKSTGDFSEDFANALPKKLSNVRNLITLVSVMETDPEMKKIFAPNIFGLIDTYAKKNKAELAYYTFVISLLDYDQESMPAEFTGKLMGFLDSKSLYIFSNTMAVLYHFGQTNLLLQAMDKVQERNGFYHKKLLVDGLLSSNVDFEVFNRQLAERFPQYTPYMQDCVLDFFRLNHYDASDLCMKLLRNEQVEDQVKFAAMRYFAKYPTPESEVYFLKLLEGDTPDWLPQMLAIQGLAQSREPKVRQAVKNKLTSRDWYVRVNAAQYLYAHDISEPELHEILYMRDKFATETMRYCCRNNQELSDYITRMLAFMEEEDRKNAVDDETNVPPAADGVRAVYNV